MNRKGFTLVEILAVIAVIGIIVTGTYATFNRSWRNNQTDICESDLRELSNGFSSYFVDYGNIVIPDDANYEAVLKDTVAMLNRGYINNQIEVASISPDKKSAKLSTKFKTDPWGNKYELNLNTYSADADGNIPGLIVIYSKGVDGKSSINTYKDGNYGDDVVAVVQPKTD